ncbi:MAG: hypothetical protein RIR52_2327 [Acidobacteriota bacterium]
MSVSTNLTGILTGILTGWRDITLATIFPFACRVCDRPVTRLEDGVGCGDCWGELAERLAGSETCTKCGVILRDGARVGAGERECGRCRGLSFVAARSVGPHEGVLRESVLWLKRHPQIGQRLERMIGEAWTRLPDPQGFDGVIPIPLHPRRQARRSFNQAEVIGRRIGRASGCRLETVSLTRVRDTERHRLGMGDEERARSLRGAFAVVAPRLVRDRRLLLVDDVLTTGSTADEAARTLLECGAREVALLTISRVERVRRR